MALSRKDFDCAKAGDKIIDASGREWLVVAISDRASRVLYLYHQGDTYRFTLVNGCLIDENMTIYQSLSHKNTKLVPSK